ncbi:substrate-binding domain-containing protein [Aquitalea sp.]|uniref:substrate-binding domain-containing protein n=1 Tax=Aquitalea sp. TaxID=1872623 RepID=UPI00258EA02D|nr:substrate-binding domain-containing protein [Aquitalea sp.]
MFSFREIYFSWAAWLVPIFFCVPVMAEKKLTVGAVYLDTQGYYAGVKKGIQDAAKNSGVHVQLIETNVQGDIAKEGGFIDTLIARKVDAIILSAVSEAGSAKNVSRAAAANIPVICYNTCLSKKNIDKYVTSYLVGDPFAFGTQLGNIAADYFVANKISAPKIGVINCEAFEVCKKRRLGFESVLLKRLPKAQVVANQEGTSLDKSISVAERILIANKDIDAFMGESGGATLGAVKAVRNQRKIGKVVVFGADMTTEIAQALQDNKVLKGIVDISGKKMGGAVFMQTVAVINGKKSGEKIIPMPIDSYRNGNDASQWLRTHVDGLP